MNKSISQKIIDKWLENLEKIDISNEAIELFRIAANENSLDDAKELKRIIKKIEVQNAKD